MIGVAAPSADVGDLVPALGLARRARAAVADDAYLTAWAAATGASRANEVGIWSNAADMTTIIGEEVQGALLGQKSVDDAVAAMQTRLTESMANATPAS